MCCGGLGLDGGDVIYEVRVLGFSIVFLNLFYVLVNIIVI